MNRDELKSALMKHSAQHNIDLTKNWDQKSDANLKKYLDELQGKTTTVPTVKAVTNVSKPEKSTTNPFGEDIVMTMVPIDKTNPKIKIFTVSINGKKLVFPLGKMAHMPKSYFEVYLNSQDKETQVMLKQSENHYKEI